MLVSRSYGVSRCSRSLLQTLRTPSVQTPKRVFSTRPSVTFRTKVSPMLQTRPQLSSTITRTRFFSSTPRSLATEDPSHDPNARPPWIDVLESVSNGPWLHTTIPDEPLRLAIAHGLMYQLLLYLSRPIDGVNMEDASKNEGAQDGDTEGQISDAHAQYLSAFAVARVPSTSEMGRARIAATKVASGVLHQLNSIPTTSQLRTDHPDLFRAVERLTGLAEKELKDGGKQGELRDGAEWKDFWGHAQPVVVELAQMLSEKGFMLEQEGKGGEGEGQA